MERRDFLKAGAAAGVAAAAGGCASSGASATVAQAAALIPVHPDEVAFLTGHIDGVLGAMDHKNLVHELVPADVPIGRDAEHVAEVERLLQNSVRSLYVSATFLDQSAEMQAQPEVQRRVADALPIMDDAVRQSTVILTSLGDVDQARFQQALRQHPDLGMRVAEALDARAGEIGISARRRMQLRAAAAQITTRMCNQHPAVLADEYLRKTNKAYVRHGQPELVRKVAARAGEQMFWAPVVAAAPAAPYAPPGSGPAAPETRPAFGPSANNYVPPGGDPYGNYSGPSTRPPRLDPQPPALPSSIKHPGDGAFRAAGWMFGIGIGSLAGGAMLVGVGVFPGVFLLTVGVVLILLAIVTALVGLIIRAAG